jgi:type II secretion system protein G
MISVAQNSKHLGDTNDQSESSAGKVKSASALWSSICSIAGFLIIFSWIWCGRPLFHSDIPVPVSVSFALEIIGFILGIIGFVRTQRLYGLIINAIPLIYTTLLWGGLFLSSRCSILNNPTSKKAIAKISISEFEQVLQAFQEDTSRFPTTAEGLDALVHNPGNLKDWNGPYLKKAVMRDPWRREYIYQCPGNHGPYDLYSFGPDGDAGTDDDIVSWKNSK